MPKINDSRLFRHVNRVDGGDFKETHIDVKSVDISGSLSVGSTLETSGSIYYSQATLPAATAGATGTPSITGWSYQQGSAGFYIYQEAVSLVASDSGITDANKGVIVQLSKQLPPNACLVHAGIACTQASNLAQLNVALAVSEQDGVAQGTALTGDYTEIIGETNGSDGLECGAGGLVLANEATSALRSMAVSQRHVYLVNADTGNTTGAASTQGSVIVTIAYHGIGEPTT